MFNDWYTINVEIEIAKDSNEAILVNAKQQTKDKNKVFYKSDARSRVLTVTQRNGRVEQNDKVNLSGIFYSRVNIKTRVTTSSDRNISRKSKVYVQANYENDRHLQKGTHLLETHDAAQVDTTHFTLTKDLLFLRIWDRTC